VASSASDEVRIQRTRALQDIAGVSFGGAVAITGGLYSTAQPSMSFTAEDAQFMCKDGVERGKDCRVGVLRWEHWSIQS
jgi:hypothetical protein